jgi:uncharacterized protein (TIGR01244 family)
MRPLSPTVWTSPQISPDAMTVLAEAGVERVINNRPDDEEPGQPASTVLEAAARAAGLQYLWVPIRGLPDAAQTAAVGEALADDRRTLLFCRSGMRSAAVWALAQRAAGADPRALREAAAAAGYDLSGLPL